MPARDRRLLSLRTKLYSLIGASLLALAVVAAGAAYSIGRGAEYLRDVYEHRVEPTSALLEIDAALKEVRFRMAGFLLDQMPAVGNGNHLREVRAILPQAWQRFTAAAEEQTFSTYERDLIVTVDVHLRDVTPFLDELKRAYANDDKAVVTALLEDVWPLSVHATILKPIARIIPVQQAAVRTGYERAREEGRQLIVSGAVALAIVVAALLVIATRLARGMNRRLGTAVSIADKIAAGDWSGAVEIEINDEIGQLLRAIERMREQVHAREERLQAVLENAAEGIVTFDQWGRIEGFNRAAERLFGWTEQAIRDASIGVLLVPDEPDRREGYVEHFLRHEIQRLIGFEGEFVGRRADGTTFPMALKISRMPIAGEERYIALIADISERRALMDQLRTMAERDGLSGLYNRSYFQDELVRAVERAHRTASVVGALLYIDLDNFKYVNDTLGHAAGDQLIVQVASILRARTRKSDLVARFGGDEFTVLLYDAAAELRESIADSFRRQIATLLFSYEGRQVDIGCSIGVATIGPEVRNAEDALSQADLACHLAKRAGRNRIHVFDPSDADSAASMSLDMGWSRRIKQAIESDRFLLACQPIVRTDTREIAAYEVLVRLRDDDGGIVMPSGFLPAAERFGLATEIDLWVIAHAIETLARQRQTFPQLCYTINLSAQTLARADLAACVGRWLGAAALEPSALIFEVTETAAITDMNAAGALLATLRELGCGTALDDFGSGMSSFGYLRELPVDYVKIDGRFVRQLATSPVDQAMVRAMNDIAHALGKRTIAECVENEDGLRVLTALGVDFAQGYYLGRPDVVTPCEAIGESLGVTVCAVPRG
jgi:diguanylate cyclase (GGDEF)-like protein/PAS domain S-box-containing protein